MKKKLCAVLAGCLLLGSVPVFGIAPEQMVTEAMFYTASLYYCDAPRNKIVLKNVKPKGTVDEKSQRTAAEAEYQEIWASGLGKLQNGGIVPLEELNNYADSQVQAVIVRSESEGIRVVAIKFL